MSVAAQLSDYSVTDADCLPSRPAASPASLRSATDNVTRVVYPTPRMHVRWAINSGERHYALASTFVLELEALEEGGFFASHASLPVSGWGETPRAAIDELCEAFDVQYRALVDAPEAALSPGALKHRAAFQSIVATVLPSQR